VYNENNRVARQTTHGFVFMQLLPIFEEIT